MFLVGSLLSKALIAQLNHAEKQIEWIRSQGGFFSPKIEFQLLDKNDPSSPMGIFALEDLSKKETLMVIPQSCLLTSGGSFKTCDTARNLVKQRLLKNTSKFAPYVDYVFDPKHKGHLPSSWSQAGKSLIQKIIGEEMPPYDVAGISFEEECGGSGEALEEEAYLIVMRRSWDDLLVPVFDMVNHRNGRWYNIDSNSAHDGTDITVFASRDVKAGEQLYLSYNECVDCDYTVDYALRYTLPDILKDYGFVEQYPRRWRFETNKRALVFELDQDPVTNELQLTWLSKKPTKYHIRFLHGHLNRLKDLEDYVNEQASQLDSSHERYVSLEYYEALKTALEYALLNAFEENVQQECPADSEACVAYDELDSVPEEMEFNHDACDLQRILEEEYDPFYELIDFVQSFYQKIQFDYSEEKNDTCLYLNGGLHACTSFRAHYHEVFVHYPARFVNEVKRVAFLGGGDNMIVHEIMKYPSLELVVGLELDQQVVRGSFKNLGTQPYFDDERLQWWFGDASKSLLLLPEEYYGSFDVVYVDIENNVMDILKVTDELGFMDAAMLLLKPDGVIARNQDWDFATADPFTDYTVDLFYVDVPIYCQQGIVIGSKTVDFLTQTPKDHGVDTVYLKRVNDVDDRFEMWYNYRKSNHTNKFCMKAGSEGKKLLTEELKRSLGILMVVEAEDVAVSLDSPSSVQASLSTALKNAGLMERSVKVSPWNEKGYEIVVMLQEGYLVTRTLPKHKYCAFDLMLWSNTDKHEEAKAQLVKAVGSKSVSSYRIITGGMFGISDDDSNVGPSVSESCDDRTMGCLVQETQAEPSNISTILTQSLSLFQDTNASVLVLCGEKSSPCNSLDVLDEKEPAVKVSPIWACPTLESEVDASQPMNVCERDTQRHLEELDYKISGIVIDAQAPRVMGQILHKVLSGNKLRRKLLTDKYIVLSISPSDGSVWRRAFLDRFRTEFARFDPAYRAELLLNNLEYEVFSSGDTSFFSHLMEVTSTIKDMTGISPNIQTIKNGVNNYVADFKPTKIFSHHDYDFSASLKQWSSQQPLSEQSVLQFKVDKESESYPLSAKTVKEALQNALLKMANSSDHHFLDVQLYENVGDGCLIVGFSSTGSAILTWDGKEYISVNLLSNQSHETFLKVFTKNIALTLTAWDEMPRGIGRVVNFQEDLGSRDEPPHWA